MRVVVDPWECQSHLTCCALAPELFTYDDDHSYSVAIEGEVPEHLVEVARQAVIECPEGAITLE
jgi:ferredoxin